MDYEKKWSDSTYLMNEYSPQSNTFIHKKLHDVWKQNWYKRIDPKDHFHLS